MPLFTEERLRARARAAVQPQSRVFSERIIKGFVNEALTEQLKNPTRKTYDIFLSHSTGDSEQVWGLKLELEDLGYSVYIDWIDDPQLDRSRVTKDTADTLRERMKSCKSLFYAYSVNAAESKWMPWELGYFDGLKQKAAVLPIRANSFGNNDDYKGSEYVGLYYYISKDTDKQGETKLWVHEEKNKYILYDLWLDNDFEPVIY